MTSEEVESEGLALLAIMPLDGGDFAAGLIANAAAMLGVAVIKRQPARGPWRAVRVKAIAMCRRMLDVLDEKEGAQ